MSFQWQDQRVVITGGTGFLGSHLVEQLRAKSPRSLYLARHADYDLTQENQVARLLEEHPADVVIHLAGLVGGVAAALGYLVRRRRPGQPPARAERSVNLDVGEVVQVEHWQADGTALIRYRGAPWTAMLRPGAEARRGPQRVVELVGSRLLVEPV